MNKSSTFFLPAFLLAIVFYFLFRNESPGINVLLFFLLSSFALAILKPGAYREVTVKVAFAASLLSALFIIVMNTDVSIISYWIWFAVMIGFIHQSQMRSAAGALLTFLLGLIASPLSWWNGLELAGKSSKQMSSLLKYLRLSLIPLAVLFFFFILYSIADQQFEQVSNQLFTFIFDQIKVLFDYISPATILFFIFSMLIAAAILLNRDMQLIVKMELLQNDFLQRKKKKPTVDTGEIEWWQLFFRKSMRSLQNEFNRGLLLLVMVNSLLLFVNVVDVKMVWFENTANASPYSRSQAVHESTYLLLFSIVVAMAILLFFFRGNLNFLKNNRRLLQLSYLWIAQNAILAFTAGIRNYYYIRDYGLAYKRIGVIFFLLLILFSLLILFIKIRDKRSFFYLYKMEGWALCSMLVLMSCFNWDPLIATYNLTHFDDQHIDRNFLMTLSHRALPVIMEYERPFNTDPATPAAELTPFQHWIKIKGDSFIAYYESTSWPSWNFEDEKVYRSLTSQPPFL